MSEIGTLINSLCHIGFIVYVLTSIAEVKKMLRNIQKREQDKAESEKNEKLLWLGKNCKDCGNEKCKKLGTLPQGYDCALWQEKESEEV